MDLKGRIAMITGASRGIGAATAKLLAKHVAAVAVNYFRSKESADKVVAEIAAAGGTALALQADVRNREEVAEMVKKVHDELGPIDILVLNAGMPVPWKPFVELTTEEFETKVFGEMRCFFHTAREVIPTMIERKKGCIVGISSGLSRKAGYGFSAHTTVKSGIDGMMKSLALELGPMGIRVNTVAPGLTMTDATSWLPRERVDASAEATPMKRVGQPEDIAGAVLAVVSDESGFVTGNYISVSGGNLMI
jgi:3-oxoacyl-[acyl-carrier protein] reductase